MLTDLDDKPDGYYFAKTKHLGVWRMLRKATDRQDFIAPWKDIEDGRRVSWSGIRERYSELVKVNHP